MVVKDYSLADHVTTGRGWKTSSGEVAQRLEIIYVVGVLARRCDLLVNLRGVAADDGQFG